MLLGLLGGEVAFTGASIAARHVSCDILTVIATGIILTVIHVAAVTGWSVRPIGAKASVMCIFTAIAAGILCTLPLLEIPAVSGYALLVLLFVNSIALWIATPVALGVALLQRPYAGAGRLRLLAGACIVTGLASLVSLGGAEGIIAVFWPAVIALLPASVAAAMLARREPVEEEPARTGE